MALKIGELEVSLGVDTSPLKKAEQEVKKTAKGLEESLTRPEKAAEKQAKKTSKATTSALKETEKQAKATARATAKASKDALKESERQAKITAKETSKATKVALKESERQAKATAKATGKAAKKALKETEKQAKATSKAFKRVGLAVTAAFSIEVARRLILVVDNLRVLERRLVRFTGSVEAAEESFDRLAKTASDVGAKIADTVTIFERFSLIRDEIGATNEDILRLTETLSKLGAIGGSSSDEIKNGLRQLSQGLAAGTIRAEEFNSLVENTPTIIKAIGREMGLSIGELRKELLAGQLTANQVFNALQAAAAQTDREFAELPKTITIVTQALKNELAIALKDLDEGLGFTDALSESISSLAEMIKGINEANKAAAEQEKIQQRINKILSQGMVVEKEAVRNNRGRITSARVVRDERSKEVLLAQELNDLLDKQLQLQEKIARPISGRSERGDLTGIKRRARIAAAEASKELTRIELADTEKRIQALIRESSVAREVANLRSGKAPEAEEEILKVKAKPGLTDAQQKQVDKIKLLGETEREEIERTAAERRMQILALDQLEADERNALLTQIGEERLSQLGDLEARQLEQEESAAQQRVDAQEELLAAQVDALRSGSSAIADILRSSGNDQAARAANLIQGVSSLAATIVAISAAQAKAQAAADPTAITLPQKIANIAIIASQFVGIFSALRSAKGGGRQFGGSVSPQLAHPINEGGTPEILTQGSQQFLLPNGKGGQVTPISGGGGGGSNQGTPNITIISNGTPQTIEGTNISRDEVALMINDSEKKINAGLSTGRGDTGKALQNGFKVERNIR